MPPAGMAVSGVACTRPAECPVADPLTDAAAQRQNGAMADGTDNLVLLRRLVGEVAERISMSSSHARLGRDLAEIGLPEPPRKDGAGPGLSVSGRREWSLGHLADREVA